MRRSHVDGTCHGNIGSDDATRRFFQGHDAPVAGQGRCTSCTDQTRGRCQVRFRSLSRDGRGSQSSHCIGSSHVGHVRLLRRRGAGTRRRRWTHPVLRVQALPEEAEERSQGSQQAPEAGTCRLLRSFARAPLIAGCNGCADNLISLY